MEFDIIEKEDFWLITYGKHTKHRWHILKIDKYLQANLSESLNFKPFIQFINEDYYIIYIDYAAYEIFRQITSRKWVIKRTNLTHLTLPLQIQYLPKNIGLKIMSYLNINNYSQTIDIARHRGKISYKMSTDKKLIHVITYDGYNAKMFFYSLQTFKQLSTPTFLVTHCEDDFIKYQEHNDGTLITCTLMEPYFDSIGKWGFPRWLYDDFYLEDSSPAAEIIAGKNGMLLENYYTLEDIQALRTYDENEIEGKMICVERYVLKYNEFKDEISIVEYYKNEEFYNIFKYAVCFNNDYR